MLKIENSLLHQHINKLSLKLAFSRIKLWNFKNGQNDRQQRTSTINKELYLSYIEEVLKKKEIDLIKLDKQLIERENRIQEQKYKKKIKIILEQIEGIKMIEKKLRVMQQKIGIRNEQYVGLFQRFQLESNKSKIEMEQIFKKEYNDLVDQRRILRNKISQFAQLESYQKYLNQLHTALEAKSQQLIERESMLSQGQEQLQQQFQQMQINSKQASNYSNRKRIKIFNAKLHYPSEQMYGSKELEISKEKYATNAKDNMKLNFNFNLNSNSKMNISPHRLEFNNQTFSKSDHQPNSKKKNVNNQNMLLLDQDSLARKDYGHFDVNQSSAILAENSRQDTRQDFQTNQQNLKICTKYYETESKTENRTCDNSVQVDSQTMAEAGDRLRKQRILLKFARKWMKYCFDSNKNAITKQKLMAVNIWKINTFFDQSISQTAISSIESLQRVWRKQQKILYSSKMFPYNELSLKRKKYAELMFDLEQKVYHRKRVENLLRSILTQRHRKQRFIFYLYFCKFMKNSCYGIKEAKESRDKVKLGQTGGTISASIINTQSRTQILNNQSRTQILSMNSSHILNQQKILQPHKKSSPLFAPPQSKSPIKTQPLSRQPSTKLMPRTNKQNKPHQPSPSPSPSQPCPQFHKILQQKQRTQRLLATQCVRLQGLIKMCVIMTESTFRTNNWAMKKLLKSEYEQKIEMLSQQVDGLEFRFDLVMTKCKVGLANNSNKLSTLEGLLDFGSFGRS